MVEGRTSNVEGWLLLQLSDSAFPTGGFAHSGGLEAAVQAKLVSSERDVWRWLGDAVWGIGWSALPFVSAASAGALAEVDAACDAFLTSAVANRASRTQGRAFVETCARVFPHPEVAALRVEARPRPCHHAPMFGAVTRALGASADEARRVFLHLSLRGLASSAVRLGVIGPHLAQRMCFDLHDTLERVAADCAELSVDEAAWTAPLQELIGGTHERLYSRLFVS
ncbi:MAG: urease accessory protein UreF [Deltaproteobacteria bacterium]|nr:urease accessory protein UreF [Deltaproteobacteria bacterium]